MKILVVSPAWIGDAVMAQSLYKIIKRDQPECQLSVLAPSWTLPILRRMSEVNASFLSPFNHGELRLKERFTLARRIRESSFDQAVILTNSFKSALIPYLAQIPIRTSWLGEFRYGLINDIRDDTLRHKRLMIERFAALTPASRPPSKDLIPYPRLVVNKNNVNSLVKANKISLERETIVFCPGAEFGIAKRWPTYHFAVVVDYFLKKGWNTIILGSDKDSLIAMEITNLTSNDNSCLYNLTGKTSIEDALDLLSISRLVLTNDSGLMHLAAAVGASIVALYGPTSPDLTPPLSSSSTIMRKNTGFSSKRTGDRKDGYDTSLFEISPEEVIGALYGLL